MPTSKAGISTEAGFTLIEFALVILILGIVFTLALPRIYHELAPDPLRTSAEQLAEGIRRLRVRALTSGGMVRLRLTLPSGRWRAEGMGDEGKWLELQNSPLPPGKLPKEVRLIKVRFTDGREVVEGRAELRFLPTGETEEALLLIAGAMHEERTLLVRPFLNRVEVHRGRLAQAGG